MTTNREIYLAISAIAQRASESTRTLEEYLRALLVVAQCHEGRSYLDPSEFLDLLRESLIAHPLAYDPAWGERYDKRTEPKDSFVNWQATVMDQVVDLHEMADAGVFNNELRYFGIAAPRGARWYNFDVGTYLECAVAGAYGGWEPGDSSGREFVPGEVAILEADGTVSTKDPRELKRPIVTIERVTWLDFIHFIEWGEIYE